MALATEITLESAQDTLEVAVGLTHDGKINLKVCPGPTMDGGVPYRHTYSVLHQPDEEVAVLRLRRNPRDTSVVKYTVVTQYGNTVYKGIKFPCLSVGKVGRGVGYKLNRFFGKQMFRINDDEMSAWAKSVAISMRGDAMRHARTMAK